MSEASSIPWEGVGIIALTVIAMFVSIVLIAWIVQWVAELRDVLRKRYVGGKWEPQWIDLPGLPGWVALEIFCLAFLVTVGLLIALLAYQTARDGRDWWHEGAKGRR